MRKYNNPRLLNTVVSGTGMLHPVKPHVIVSDTVSEFVKGDLMDANAISELVDQKIGSVEGSTETNVTELRLALAEETAARTSADQTLDDKITDLSTSIPQAISDGVAQIVAGADADYDTLKEISDYIKSDKTGAAQLSTAINNNTIAIDNEATRALAKEAELEAAIDTKAAQSTTYTKAEVDTLVNSVDVSEQLANYYTKSEIDNAGYLTEHQDISNKADRSELFSGDYNDLTNKPTIPTVPTNVSEFTNDAGYITQHLDISGKANTSDLAAVATSGSYNDLDDKPTIPTVPTNVSSFTNDANYQTQQLVDDRFTALINAAPEALDTLGEIATKLYDNDDAVSAIVTSISDEVDAREAADIAITTNITELASTVSANNTAINNKVDALETSLEDRISDVEDAMPTKVSDLANDAGNKLNGQWVTIFNKTIQLSKGQPGRPVAALYSVTADERIALNTKYRVTFGDQEPIICYSYSHRDVYDTPMISPFYQLFIPLEYDYNQLTDAIQLKSWFIRGSSSNKGILIAKYYDDSTSVPDNLDVKIERFAGSTIDDIYIAPTSITPDFARQLLSKKLDISTFDSTAVSHFENDKHYTSFIPTSPKVGDYLYSDGTISTDVISGKTVVAVCVAPPWQFEDHKARFVGINRLGNFKWASTSTGGYYSYDRYDSIYDLKTNALFDRSNMFNSIVALHLPTDMPVGTVRTNNGSLEYRVAVQNGNSYVLGFDVSSGEQVGDDAKLGNAPQLNADSSEYSKINPLYKYEGSALSDLDGEGHTQILATFYKASTNFPAFFTANSQQAISGNNWYIPAIGELAYVFANINVINAKINAVGGTPIITSTTGETLMSSTMAYNTSTIYKISTLYGTVDTSSKTTSYTTRAFIKADATFGNVEYNDTYLGFVTKDDLSTVAKTGSYNDLTDKPTIPTKVSELTNDAGYLALHQSLDNYYTKAEVDSSQQTLNTEISSKADKSTTYTKTEVDNLVSPKANSSDVYSKTEADSTFIKEHLSLSEYAKKTELVDSYSKTETNELLANKANSADLATIATTGSYNDLTNKPMIPTKVSELQNDAEYLSLAPDANGHEYVDLGLPSGTLWATMNVGATSETDYGNYYQYGKGAAQYAATSGDSNYGGTEDPLDSSVDTASQVWGGSWHMPTRAQMQELTANTTYQWVTNYKGSGINGGTFTATNGAVLFIPAAGVWSNGSQYGVGNDGYYWGSSPGGSKDACFLDFNDGYEDVYDIGRKKGHSVRGVLDSKQLHPVAYSGDYNDLINKPTIWAGTQAEYDAITSPSASTIYFIKG